MMNRSVLQYIRSITQGLLTSSCTIQVEGTTRGSFGQNVTGWTDVATVRCRILPAGPSDSERAEDFAGAENIKTMRRLIVAHDVALDVGQRVVIGGDAYYVASLEVGVSDEAYRAAVIVRRWGADE